MHSLRIKGDEGALRQQQLDHFLNLFLHFHLPSAAFLRSLVPSLGKNVSCIARGKYSGYISCFRIISFSCNGKAVLGS